MIEIERKFLVRDKSWGTPLSSRRIEQGYLFIDDDRSMRIRRSGDSYTLTLKVAGGGLARHEIETHIEPGKGQFLLEKLCVEPPLLKTRLVVYFGGKNWEIDVFDGANAGLIVAEIELSSEEEPFALPSWAGPEVTDDNRFFNAALAKTPFSEWGVPYAALLAEKER